MVFKLFVLIFALTFVNAKDIDLKWLKDKPRTYAKDFYIWQYLQQKDVNKSQALKALGLTRHVNKKIFYSYAKKSNNKDIKFIASCMKKSSKNLLKSNARCMVIGFTLNKASRLNKNSIKKIISKTKKDYPSFSKRISLLTKNPNNLSKKKFLELFTKVNSKYRVKHLNKHYSRKFLKALDKYYRFNIFIKQIVTNNLMNKTQKSLFYLKSKKYTSATNFYLAINLISHNRIKKAMIPLNYAYKKTSSTSVKNKILFWKYIVSDDRKYIKVLLKSKKIDIYTLFAKDFYQKKLTNAVFTLKQKKNNKKDEFNELSQFEWIKVLRDSKRMSNKKMKRYERIFDEKDLLPHLAFVKERYFKYTKSYFINPYKSLIKKYSLKRQHLINAIAKQESRFIPSSISTAYAMGVMQIMPFLSKAIAKNSKDSYNIFNMLKANLSIKYANKHLNYLEKTFTNPLLIAYAYNGGGGFTRSMFRKGLFVKKGPYEPYLSMEKVPYLETREYGKKVLANYIVYSSKNSKRLRVGSALKDVNYYAKKSISKRN